MRRLLVRCIARVFHKNRLSASLRRDPLRALMPGPCCKLRPCERVIAAGLPPVTAPPCRCALCIVGLSHAARECFALALHESRPSVIILTHKLAGPWSVYGRLSPMNCLGFCAAPRHAPHACLCIYMSGDAPVRVAGRRGLSRGAGPLRRAAHAPAAAGG